MFGDEFLKFISLCPFEVESRGTDLEQRMGASMKRDTDEEVVRIWASGVHHSYMGAR